MASAKQKLHNFGFNFTLIKTNSGSRIQATSAICQFKRNITVNVARMVKPCTNMYGNPSKKKSRSHGLHHLTRVISPPVCLLVKKKSSDNLPILENTSCFMSRTVAATTCAIKVPVQAGRPAVQVLTIPLQAQASKEQNHTARFHFVKLFPRQNLIIQYRTA